MILLFKSPAGLDGRLALAYTHTHTWTVGIISPAYCTSLPECPQLVCKHHNEE